MIPRHRIPRQWLAVTTSILLLSLAAAPAAGLAAADEEAQGFWKKLFGKELKLKGDPAVYVDATGDAIDVATGQHAGGPGYADATDFAILTTKLSKAQVNALRKKQQAKNTQAVLGNQANPKPGQTWMFVGVRTAEKLPAGVPGGVQFNAAFDGPDAVGLYPSGALDAVAGNALLTILGQFDGFEQLLAGTTDLAGTPPGERPSEYNNAPARASGFVQGDTWVIGQPVPKGTDTAAFRFQTIDGSTQLIDPLTTPSGVDAFPTGGPAIPEDFCYSGMVFASLDVAGEPSVYQVELALEGSQLSADDVAGITLLTAGDDPQPVPGGFQFFPEANAAFGNFVADPGQVQIAIDSRRAPDPGTGIDTATLRDGAVIDLQGTTSGSLFGSPCGLLESVEGGISEGAAEAFVAHIGGDPTNVEHVQFGNPDGTDVHVAVDVATGQPIAAITAGGRPSTVLDFERRIGTSFGEVTDVDIGSRGVLEVTPDGTRRYFWLTLFERGSGPLEFGRIFSVEVLLGGFLADGPAPEELIPAEGPPPQAIADFVELLQEPYLANAPVSATS